jgi:hypothetical protein
VGQNVVLLVIKMKTLERKIRSRMNTNERNNEMNIPGFTAEASVYKTSGNYQMTGTANDLAGNRGVVPQMSAPCRETFRNCVLRTLEGAPTADIWCNIHEVFCVQ